MDKRSVYRVNYYVKGQSATAFVCAFSEGEASAFLGVRDGSAAVSRVAYPVEVVGVDKEHAEVAPPEIVKAPFDLPRDVSRDDFNALKAQLDALTEEMNLKNTPAIAAPTTSLEPTQVQADPLPKESIDE